MVGRDRDPVVAVDATWVRGAGGGIKSLMAERKAANGRWNQDLLASGVGHEFVDVRVEVGVM